MSLGRRACLSALLGVGLLACEERSAVAIPVARGPVAGPQAWSHGLRFASGVRLDAIVVTPAELEPGGSLRLRWRAEGPVEGARARVQAWPPRAGARQVARGGQGAPPVEVPLDPRVSTVVVPLTPGEQEVSLSLPSPWHPPQVLLTVELLDGEVRVPCVEGPRREDGRGQLALVDVAARPVAIEAAAMAEPPALDGRLDEPGWAAAVEYPLVHSLDGEPYGDRPGTVRWAWDAQALYVGAAIEDPDVWAEYRRRDDPLWKEEVFEVFVFGDAERRGYLELQVSPRGVVFDARFERYRKGDTRWDGAWRAAVHLRGTLDDRRDRDEGWSAELAVPWAEICEHTEVSCPPRAGQQLRVNAFRFERPHKRAVVGLAVSPPRVPDFHAPENAAVLKLTAP